MPGVRGADRRRPGGTGPPVVGPLRSGAHRQTRTQGRGRPAPAAAYRGSRQRCPTGATPPPTSGPSTPTAPPSPTGPGRSTWTSPTRPTWSPTPAPRPNSIATLDWCHANGYVTIPYGGGSSVVWGVNPPEDCGPSVTIALDGLDKVLEIDEVSRAARIPGRHLRPRSGGSAPAQRATRCATSPSRSGSPRSAGGSRPARAGTTPPTTPTSTTSSSRSACSPRGAGGSPAGLPGSGAGPVAGPDGDRLARASSGSSARRGCGSSAGPRSGPPPGIAFASWEAGYTAVRHIVQAKLWPANLRILDPAEAGRAAGLDGTQSLVIVSFESADLTQRHNIAQAVEIARAAGGRIADEDIRIDDGQGTPTGRGGCGRRLARRLHRHRTGRGHLVSGWSATRSRRRSPGTAGRRSTPPYGSVWARCLRAVFGEHWSLSCRFTHVYPDGPAPYYSWSGFGRQASELTMWQEVKAEANAAIVDAGGTATHHHAVGRMHRPNAYDRQRPDLFAEALRAAKKTLDPGRHPQPRRAHRSLTPSRLLGVDHSPPHSLIIRSIRSIKERG